MAENTSARRSSESSDDRASAARRRELDVTDIFADGNVRADEFTAMGRRGWSGQQREVFDVRGTHRREVTVIESCDVTNPELGARDYRGIHRTERE